MKRTHYASMQTRMKIVMRVSSDLLRTNYLGIRKNLMPMLLFLLAFAVFSCEDSSTLLVERTMKSSEVLNYDFGISGDEETVIIKIQATHFEISETYRDSVYSVNYRYKPELGFIGTEYVEFEACTGGEGTNCTTTVYEMSITVTE